jgi:single-strand DNA-binding protein
MYQAAHCCRKGILMTNIRQSMSGLKNTACLDEAIQSLDERLHRWTRNYNEADKGTITMSGFNRVVLVGNLTRDPEMKELSSGTRVGQFGLAINEYYKDRNQETQSRVCFVDVAVWRNLAQSCARYLKKGSPVLVEGRLEYESWKSAAGDTRSRLKINADRVQFLHAKTQSGTSPTSGPLAAESEKQGAQ